MLAKLWKKILLTICVIAILFNITSKFVRRYSLEIQLNSVVGGESLSELFSDEEDKKVEKENEKSDKNDKKNSKESKESEKNKKNKKQEEEADFEEDDDDFEEE